MPSYPSRSQKAPERANYKIRAFRDQMMAHIATHQPLVDVRSPREHTGELLHMEAYPQEGTLRGGQSYERGDRIQDRECKTLI